MESILENRNHGGERMNKKRYILTLTAICIWSVLAALVAGPAQAMDQNGKWGVGVHGLIYKLGITDHSDMWTLGKGINLGLKYGLTSKFTLGLEGQIMQTYLADLSVGSRMQDGAGLTFDNVTDGPRQRAFLVGVVAEYHFMPEKKWSPYIFGGSGVYKWKWADKDWNTLISADPSLLGTGVPPFTSDSSCYYLKDQEIYFMVGAGLEYFPTEWLSLELGAKFRYLSHLLTNFRDERDIVGTGTDQLDLPRGIAEAFAGVTFYFGGKECPPLYCTASGIPTSGQAPLTVQFDGSHRGGCPDYTYAWNFGDGSTSNEKNPSHTYYSEGDCSASLTVTDSKNTAAENSVYVTVECPKLVVTASGNPTSGTAPLSVEFAGSATGGCPNYKFAWDFGDGNTSRERNPNHVYQTEGDYTALLTVTDSKNNTQEKSVSIKSSAEEYIPTPEKPVILEGVKFEFDKSALTADSRQILDRVAASLLKHPEVKVEVGGYTDSAGNEKYNMNLSEQRAKAVRDYLVNKGVPASQLTARGYGETKPIADNKTAEGRAKNRRVELKKI
ncbi:MAG: PKD domain-containing protein [Candidatus Krumholzibacteriota bacterium]|nr:PKD domain-containing protein [Candidatus Krumholzibacteriota bacterium]